MQVEEIINKYRVAEGYIETPEGCWTNFLGLHTKTDLFVGGEKHNGEFVHRMPIPDDGFYGGAYEHATLLTAIDIRRGHHKFTAVELGAGWGPWISAAGVVCARAGFPNIHLVGVEADAGKYERMREHMRINGVDRRCDVKLIRGAAWESDTTLSFPKTEALDYGGSPTESKGNTDYRGKEYETEEIPAFSFQTICRDLDIIDFAHWDIQGAEWNVAQSCKDFLDEKVRFMFIGTHSRYIEGNLLNMFFEMGWDVMHQSPCSMLYDRNRANLVAMTAQDGTMALRNPKLA